MKTVFLGYDVKNDYVILSLFTSEVSKVVLGSQSLYL